MAVNINITPTIPNIIVSDNPSLITPDLSNYATLSTLDFTSGILNESIIRSGSYLYNLINTSAAGVSSLNGSSGILLLKGTGSVYVTTNGQTITISGDGGAGNPFIATTGNYNVFINISTSSDSTVISSITTTTGIDSATLTRVERKVDDLTAISL